MVSGGLHSLWPECVGPALARKERVFTKVEVGCHLVAFA